MLRKLFFLVFIALFIVSVVESVYLYTYMTSKSTSSSEDIDAFLKEISSTTNPPKNTVGGSNSGVLNQGYWNYLQGIGKESLTSLNATITCSGTISGLLKKPGVNAQDGYPYERGIKLKGAAKDCQFLLFDSIILKNTKFVQNVNGKEVEIKFEDLKKEDRIESETTMNLINPRSTEEVANLIKIKIIRL